MKRPAEVLSGACLKTYGQKFSVVCSRFRDLTYMETLLLFAKQHSHYQQLQLVCKKFRSVVLQNPALSSQLFLVSRSDLDQDKKINLLLWIRRYGASFKIVDVSDRIGDTVLASLTCADHPWSQSASKAPPPPRSVCYRYSLLSPSATYLPLKKVK